MVNGGFSPREWPCPGCGKRDLHWRRTSIHWATFHQKIVECASCGHSCAKSDITSRRRAAAKQRAA